MTNEEIIRNIKQDLHSQMNGVASTTMREAGLGTDYRTNFGVELPRLRTMADETIAQLLTSTNESFTNKDESDLSQKQTNLAKLAGQLWKEPIRECRILGLMLMPSEAIDTELAEVWAEQIHTIELAQLAALLLFSRVQGISNTAFHWIASETVLTQIMGYYTLIHLLRHHQLSSRSYQELQDQANAALQTNNTQLSMAATRLLSQIDSDQQDQKDGK